MPDDRQRGRTRIRVEAPVGTDPLVIAQAVCGPHVLLKAEHTHAWRTAPFNNRWSALNELYKRVIKSYDGLMKRMVEHIERYAKDEANLQKAMTPVFTPAQVQEIAAIIRQYHTAFVASVAPDTVTEAEVQLLIDAGILPPETLSFIDDAYTYGQLTATVKRYENRDALKKLGYDSFKRRVQKRPIPLTLQERAAVQWAEHSAAIHIRGLGNKVADDFATVAIEADADLRRRYEKVISDEVKQGIERRRTWRKVASEIGHATGDWSRDLGRIAATEMQRAHQEGFAQGLRKREGDDAMVAKIPNADACKHCVRLHLTNGQGSAPRIFKLSDLEANGSNVGRKAAEWKPVVGTVHPWCACELIHVPPGWRFEENPEDAGEEGWIEFKPGRWRRERDNPSRAYDAPDKITEYWIPQLVPEGFRRSDWQFERDLMKSQDHQTYGDSVPLKGVTVRIGDPLMRQEVEKVIAETPAHLFDKAIGVTLITTDTARVGSALDDHDLAYWTGNEVRLSQTLDSEKVAHTLRHELGHSLNVYLMNSLGGVKEVRDWHDKLDAISKKEGYVSEYAKKLPIENAAEVTRMYLYDRQTLMLEYPKQFTFVHRYYKPIVRAQKPSKIATEQLTDEQFAAAARATREASRED